MSSSSSHPAADALKKMGAINAKPIPKPAPKSATSKILDDADGDDTPDLAAESAYAYISLNAAAIVQEWAGTTADSLDEGETMASRLVSLLVGVADSNQDGELTDDEIAVTDVALNAAFDYLVSKGISQDDASALLNDEDDAAAQRIAEFLRASAPADDEAAQADVDDFVFDDDNQESLLDSARARDILDSAFKRRLVSGSAKKVRKSVTHAKLSSKHKVAIRKAHATTHHASALAKRLK